MDGAVPRHRVRRLHRLELSERLLAERADVVGVDAFTDYYDRETKQVQLGGPSSHPRFVADAVAATRAVMDKAPSGATYNAGGIVEELSGRSLNVNYTDPGAGDVRRTLADTTRIRS